MQRTQVGRSRGAAGLVLALSLAGQSCLFSPRDPKAPINPGGPCDGSFPPAQNPTALRDRIARSWQCRLLDSDYFDSLDPEFTYTPDANSVAHASPGFFDAWSRDREVTTIQNALAGSAATRPTEVTVSFLLYRPNGLGTADRPRYEVQYTVKLVLPDSSVVRYGGCADWELIGVTSPPVRLRTWADLNPFETGGCTPIRPVSPSVGTTGFLRFDRGQ